MKCNKISFAKYKPVVRKPSTFKNEKLLKEKINMAIKSIRKKYLALKLGKADEDETLNRLFKPIINPLKYVLKDVKVGDNEKAVSKYEDEWEKKVQREEVNIEKKEQAEPMSNKPVLDKYNEQYPPLANHYVEGYFNDKGDNYDETYGIRFDLDKKKLYMGNTEINMGQNTEIIIGDKIFDGSKGLYNLLFMKRPQDYSEQDLADYKNILQLTSAHKRNYDPLEQTVGTRSFKYRQIIKPLFKRTKKKKTRTGSGMNLIYNEKPIEYVYWDDVNELVDRLRLLNSSKLAGNTDSHDNEILAIISELHEAGIIY